MTVVIADTSDHHCGSSLGMCPPEGVHLDDGGSYMPSEANLWLWQCWQDYWAIVDRTRALEKAKLYNVYKGDLQEGFHHHSPQILSGNSEAQAQVTDAAFRIAKSLKPDREFVVRGNKAHAGESGQNEEGLARAWQTVKCPDTDTWSWWELPMEVEGVKLFFKHVPSTKGFLPHTRSAAIVRIAKHTWDEFGLRDQKPPKIASFGHIHYFGDSYDAFPTRAIVSGSWQLRTSYVHLRLPLVRAEIGGFIIIIRDGKYEIRKVEFKPKETTTWTEVESS